MIAELVRQYDTLKRCGIKIPDPFFAKLPVSLQVVLRNDGTFKVDWLSRPREDLPEGKGKRNLKEYPLPDIDCPVTEASASRSSGNESPHGIVDNASWTFGELAPEKPSTDEKKKSARQVRSDSYLNQMKALLATDPENLAEVRQIVAVLEDKIKCQKLWGELEKVLRERIDAPTADKWRAAASKANIQWVVESAGRQGKPVHSLPHVKAAWTKLQQNQQSWHIVSLVDRTKKPARLMHPKIKGGSLVSFNDSASYCAHLHPEYSRKSTTAGKDKEGSALPAQIGFDEAEKYAKALDWLVENSSVRFGDTVNCIWVDQFESEEKELDPSALDLTLTYQSKSAFSRGKALKQKDSLAETGDLVEALRRFRNAQKGSYRDKRFFVLSILLRNKGRHAVLGGFTGTMGELESNVDLYIKRSEVYLPRGYISNNDYSRKFAPSLMDVLDAAGVKSEKKKRLVWDREVVEVIVGGRPLPADLCRLVVMKAFQQKQNETSKGIRAEYLQLLAIGAGCARHFLTAILGKEQYGMGLDTEITEAGYLAGRIFAVCERIQKRGRAWGATLSDKLFASTIERPRDTLAQLYKNCLCYEMYKSDSEWFSEIFSKIDIGENQGGNSSAMPANGVDAFEFLLGYWHQRAQLPGSADKKGGSSDFTGQPIEKGGVNG